MPHHQVRVHHLNLNDNKEKTLYRLEKGWVLRFLLGPSLHSSVVRLFCNHPPDERTAFDRHTYREMEWHCPTGMRSDLTDVYADITMVCSGSFNYFYTIDESVNINKANGQGYFLVDPTLSVGTKENEEITMDCLQVQTVITKLLGPFDTWQDKLAVARETGYNMIHFTPVQELGISNSAYSIRNQHVLSPAYSPPGAPKRTMDDLEQLVKKMHSEWRVMSLTDLVLNHTSKDSPWLLARPDFAYNMKNSPYLRPAFIVDSILRNFSEEVSQGKWEDKGVPAEVKEENQLQAMRHLLHSEVFPKHKLYEFYVCNPENVLKDFHRAIQDNRQTAPIEGELNLKQDPQYRRKQSSVNIDHALYLFNTDRDCSCQGDVAGSPNVTNRDERVEKCSEALSLHLHHLNRQKEAEVGDHVCTAIENFIANAHYRYVAGHGPRLGRVTKEEPLMFGYFAIPPSHEGTVENAEAAMDREPEKVMAVNGWVMGDDPLRNFAEGSNVYLRRELIPWGDSVKLRYGQKPVENQDLWDHMKIYTEETAKIFHAVRLDNCHSTPMHVAQYMLDAARSIRPNLLVVGELFTGSEGLDNLFINKLGINSLIREAMAANDAHEEGRLVYRYGGLSVGSFAQPRVRPLVPTVAHAVFYDQTHDNPSPIEKRSVYDLWPTAALVSMANCAVGSNRGYDQLVPHHVDVVEEKREYPSWGKDTDQNKNVNLSVGITNGKRVLNNLHFELATGGYKEVFVDQLAPEVTAVTRHNPLNHSSVILVACTAFSNPENPKQEYCFRSVHVQGTVEEVLFEGTLQERPERDRYAKNDKFVNGLPNYILDVQEHMAITSSQYCSENILDNNGLKEVCFKNFTPGTVVAFRTSLTDEAKTATLNLRRGMGQFGYMMRSYSGNVTFDDTWDTSNFRAVVSHLSLGDLNRVMYRVDQEERDDNFGFSTYNIPNHGNLCYSGLRGVVSVLGEVRPNNNLGHPLCGNLRDGNWLMDYIANRLKVVGNTADLGEWFEGMFLELKKIPRYLVPCYFDAMVTGAYIVLREMALQQYTDFVKDGSTFVQALALGSIQFCGYVRSAKLPPMSPKLNPTFRKEKNMLTGEEEEAPVSMAAGLPHFAAGVWRCWGRDTFIALRGMLLVTGRYDSARGMILAFAGTLRHGLIPNLLFEGKNARYNCRDAVWWWLQAIKAFTMMAPNGMAILNDPISRLYPTDDSEPVPAGQCDMPLHAVMQEAISRHAAGIMFREKGAGPSLDEHMMDEGFNVEAGVQWPQGYVYGGNVHNCGTWMDKMGSCAKAGNKGNPATPRDGSAVELVGLCASVVRWLADLNKSGEYPYKGVTINRPDFKEEQKTFEEWANAIKQNFEKDFFISTTPDPSNEPNPELIVRRGMYKDCFNATQFWANFQLRPNFCVAMVVAPELFNEENAWTALEMAEEVLLGPLGMKTLDPNDWAYDGNYVVSNESGDPKLAHGFNYHNGPEWVWPVAYFLRAKLFFACKLEKKQKGILKKAVASVDSVLCRHYQELMNSPWKSLPELTNANGSFCGDSCRAQAWSDGCILEVLYDLERFETASRPSVLNLNAAMAKA
ncbi:hypothetical protein ACOMHN_044005 [Nucella lapillus]